jgi:GntR family transcriptional regulator
MTETSPTWSLNRDSPIPLYHQIKQIFTERVASGELQPGDPIPSEHTLEKDFRVSRSTIRRAMSELEHEGYIHRQRGRPTIISARPIYHGMTAIAGFGDDMRSQGCRPWSKVLGVSIVCADEQLAARLKIDVGDEVVTAHRLRLADDQAVCVEKPNLPLATVGAISPRDMDGEKSLYHHLREKLGIRLANVEEVVEVVPVDEETAELLQISPKSSVVRLQRTVYDDKNECIEYAVSLWRTDRFSYVAWRTGTAHIAVRGSDQESLIPAPAAV